MSNRKRGPVVGFSVILVTLILVVIVWGNVDAARQRRDTIAMKAKIHTTFNP